MREFIDLFESKWWEDSETITLYHGTSSALIDHIETRGLQPPAVSVKEHALNVLAGYVPKDQWDDELLTLLDNHAIRENTGRKGDRGTVIYTFTEAKHVEGYANSYAKHGGEIAYDVYECVLIWLGEGDKPLRQRQNRKPSIAPRFATARPIIVEMEVPRSWCLFSVDPQQVKTNATDAWNSGKAWAHDDCETLEQLLDEVFENREVRINRAVPPEMIKSIRKL